MDTCSSSMQLTRAADYAVRVMIHLATLPESKRARLPELARVTGAPSSFLSKVLQRLCAAEYLASWRGKSGGFQILPAGREVDLSKLIEAIDGPIYLNVCLTPGPSCGRKRLCPAHPAWVEAQAAMMAVLSRYKVADLAARAMAAAAKEKEKE